MGHSRYAGPQITEGNGSRIKDSPADSGRAANAPRVTRKEAPLSFGQLRLWFLDQLEPGTATYNMPMALRLRGRLHEGALRSALETLVERHKSLRTRFVSQGDDPKQVVDDLPVLDFQTAPVKSSSSTPDSRPDKHKQTPFTGNGSLSTGVREAIREEINRPFNLNHDRLLRLRILEVGPDDHVLVVTMHHVVSDEWSLKIFFDELGLLYQAYAKGVSVDLPELPLEYADYAVAQREAFASGKWENQFEYWRGKLNGREGVFELATDRPRKGVAESRGGVVRRELGRELSERCRAFEKQQQVTNFMVHLAAFNALLSRYTQQEDVLVGCPVAGRAQIETEALMGFFVNTLLFRTTVDPGRSITEFLREVRRQNVESYGNQDVPIEKIAEQLQPERALNPVPFTRLMFATQNDMFEHAKWGELEVEFLDVETDTAKFDLTFLVQGSSRGLVVRAEYNCDLFDRETIERMLEHYEILLRAAIEKPETKIRDLPLLSDSERKLVLEGWNATKSNYPRTRLIHEIFENQAADTPTTTAISFGKNVLTYRELNARANQLANYLRSRGVVNGMPVAACADRSADMIVAMLAILKAGGAYVPLDPDYPAERLEFMLRDTRSPVMLTQQRLLPRLPKDLARPICLDSDWELIARESRENLSVQGSPEQLAYVMYTSGSTGTPKGVAVPHKAVNRLVLDTNYIQLRAGDRIAHVSNISFDAATFEIWGALLNGAEVIGISGDVVLSPLDFARALQKEKITAMFLTTALFNQIASEAREAFAGLETLIVGGEAMDPKWVRRVLRGKPPRRLLNAYGPTENTTFTCCHLITRIPEDRAGIPIGRPIANTQVYILDRFGNPAPIGVPGELYTGGDGLAQGYWRRPELTAERFVPCPFAAGSEKAEILYKTGDVARFLPNGDIEFIGRTDDQVKVRGFRVELGEVEAALERFPGIKSCAAKVCGFGAEHKKLAVYYAAEDGSSPNPAEIRAFMRNALPAHMQPSAFVQLPTLPLTPNGKVNRNALPEPDHGRPVQTKTYRAARDPIEEKLVAIWQEVLAVAPVGIEDRFFDLGGHSLLAVRLVSRIEMEFGRKLRLSTIFQAPTIQDLSPILRNEVNESSVTGKSSVVEIQARGSRKPLFLVHGAGGGMFWGYINLSRHLGSDQPLYGFRSRGLDGRQEFDRVEEMAEDYVEDLRVVQPRGPYFLGGYCFGGNVAYEMARVLQAQGEDVGLLALFNCSPPNSQYTRIKITPAWLWRFAKNLYHWKDYFLQWTPSQRKAFFQWKWQQGKKRLRHLGASLTDRKEPDIGDLIDLSSFTTEERKVWEAHIRALLKYTPKPYDGKVHLFRSPSHPLWCSFDPDYGWGELAKGGVEVTVVPAAHEKILEEPCVCELAAELKSALILEESSDTAAPENLQKSDFWANELRGIPALLELPTDRSRPAVQSEKMQSERIEFPREISSGLEKVAADLQGQVADLLLASLHTLLYRYTRQEDIVVATAFCGDVLPIRAVIDGDAPFVHVFRAISSRLIAARQNRRPFADILVELNQKTEPSYHPITQVAFSCELGVECSAPECANPQFATGFDLIWHARGAGNQIEIELSYAEDLFDAATIKRTLRHWTALLSSIVEDYRRPVAQLTILPFDERRILLEEWTATELGYPKDQTLARLFREQALRTPDADALVCGQKRLTYGELYVRATLVADRLQKMGVGKGDFVGISIERSWEMLTGILGILLAGAAYVPMDPNYPADRLSFILSDARMKVLFTERKVRDKLPDSEIPLLFAEEINWKADGGFVASGSGSDPGPTDLAYVIYTSGSTGKPKGVAIEHRNVVALISWAKGVFTPGELSGVLASTSVCFDLSIFEIFVPLCLGGKVILAENALALPSLPAANEVRMINTVPSAARELVRAGGIPDSVQVINLAGEPLPTALVDALYSESFIKKVYDLYGPTETTTYSTYTLRMKGARPTIGRPLANEQVYLLDPKQQLVPIGVPGELYIGGDGVARGYLNRAELTKERFLPNPFRSGERMYRTGDLARWRADGNLEFLGRLDNQVKVRGFRIELGEIETALRKIAGLKDVVVVAREDNPGQKRLVGYVAVDSGSGMTAETLRATLRNKLPEYMVPPVFVLLASLPMTPNGKVDRKALPAPPQAEKNNNAIISELKSPTQSVVATAWREVLQVSDSALQQNFFELGGDSLQAAQVISRIQERLQIKLPLSGIFEAPTIEALSDAIDSGRWSIRTREDVPLTAISRAKPLPVSFVQERLWFFDQLLPGSPVYNVTGAWRFRGDLNCTVLESAFQSVAARHETLRTSFAYQNGVLRQVVSPEARIPFELRDLSDIQESQREKKIQETLSTETCKPFDLGLAPLIRALIVRSSANEHVLLVVAHHAIFDGWSFSILLRELQAYYGARVTGVPVLLPDLVVQYADFAAWQRERMKGARLLAELDYWRRKLAGAPEFLELPADHFRNDHPDASAGRVTIQLDPVSTRNLYHMAQQRNDTVFHTLMAALAITLAKWTGRDEMVIGTVVAGRSRSEIENTIGCFMNFLPIRLNLSEAATGDVVLKRVKTAIVEAQHYQDCPFEKIVEALNPERRLDRNPLYNVALLFQNYRAAQWGSAEFEVKPVAAPVTGAQLDLRFEIEPSESGLVITCEYKEDLFDEATIENLAQCVSRTLQALSSDPTVNVSDLALSIPGSHRPTHDEAKQRVAIASTFTAEPVGDPLKHWFRELELPIEVEFAPFNQVFQELLDPHSLLQSNRNGLNVVLIRLEDWCKSMEATEEHGAGDRQNAPSQRAGDILQRSAREFVLALRNAASAGKTPWLITICPNSPEAAVHDDYRRIERTLIQDLEEMPGVYLLTPGELKSWYPVQDYYDAAADELGHVPYTPLFFTALATSLVRKYHALKRPPTKVIVLDCDHTLWSGVCGEDGAKGVGLTPPFRELQQFMRTQHEAGRLLCLSSKNNERDVLDVFEQRGDMPLRREHFAAWRLNWHPKSENLKSLAAELGLGLDSFVFIDDNPLECADVEANCPEVLTLQLPEEPEKIPRFLRHAWIFDHLKLTAEDRKRSEMYRQNRERERLREQSLSLSDFLASLELEIAIEPLKSEKLSRAAQLTQRTNQFNLTTIRRTEADLRALPGRAEIITVTVKDRFGDYGLTGLLIFKSHAGSLVVDTFLLSCRVLGRGVEHKMLAWLGTLALERKLNWVDVHFRSSARNRPGLEFLESVGAPFRQAANGGFLFRFPAGFAAEVVFNPQNTENAATNTPENGESDSKRQHTVDALRFPKFSRCREIALELCDPHKIHQTIEAKAVVRTRGKIGYVPPQNDSEKKLCSIFQELLHVEKVGVRDNFFELGGHSLLAVRLFAEIEKQFGQKLPLVTLFQNPTVRKLARTLGDAPQDPGRSLLVPLQPQGERPPLFLVHGAGGDVLWGYANLAAHLPTDQPIYGIKSRGQAGGEEFRKISEMAACYVQEIKRLQPAGPYYFGGYCFGGNVAYEMARQLKAAGEQVGLILLLDAAPSNAGYERVTWWRPSYPFRFARNLGHWLHDFAKLNGRDQGIYIKRKLRAMCRKTWRKIMSRPRQPVVDLEEVIDPSHFPEQELKLWQIHLDAMSVHVDQPFEGEVVLIRTRGQPLFCSLEDDFCWSNLARGGVQICFAPGSHENVFMEPNVKTLARLVQDSLQTAQAKTFGGSGQLIQQSSNAASSVQDLVPGTRLTHDSSVSSRISM